MRGGDFHFGWKALRTVAFAALLGGSVFIGAAAESSARDVEIDLPGRVPALSADYGRDGAPVVVVTDQRIGPAVVYLTEGQRVSWSSYSGEPLRISFDADVTRSMHCKSVVNFAVEDDRVRSGILRAGDRAHLCGLEPGVYRYRVERDRMSVRGASMSERMTGTIIVRAKH